VRAAIDLKNICLARVRFEFETPVLDPFQWTLLILGVKFEMFFHQQNPYIHAAWAFF
jgi:hypothetical protein